MPRAIEGRWVGAGNLPHPGLETAAPPSRLALGPSYHSSLMGGHSYLMGGLGWWILQVSGPAAPYLDGLAQKWRAPLGVGEVCRHGG